MGLMSIKNCHKKMKLYITVLSGSFVQFSMGFIIHGQFDKLCKVMQSHDDPFISHGNSWGRLTDTDSHTLAYFGIPPPGGPSLTQVS